MSPLVTRLRALTSLSETDLRSLDDAVQATVEVPPHADIVPEGSGTAELRLLVEGWACRYKLLPDGRRQIPALVLPGDAVDLEGLLLRRIHHGVAALTSFTVAVIPHRVVASLIETRPGIRDALWWLTLVENAMATQWSVCLGRLSAAERVAHLFCEVHERLTIAGVVKGNRLPFPVTQDELADVLGISAVHVNRVLQDLRSTGLITLEGRILTIHDPAALAMTGCFDPAYLHRDGLRRARPAFLPA